MDSETATVLDARRALIPAFVGGDESTIFDQHIVTTALKIEIRLSSPGGWASNDVFCTGESVTA